SVPMADGIEDIADEAGFIDALCELKGRHPELRRAVVKLDEGFSGEGNAMFSFAGAPTGPMRSWIKENLAALACEATSMSAEAYLAKLREMKGVAEAFV